MPRVTASTVAEHRGVQVRATLDAAHAPIGEGMDLEAALEVLCSVTEPYLRTLPGPADRSAGRRGRTGEEARSIPADRPGLPVSVGKGCVRDAARR